MSLDWLKKAAPYLVTALTGNVPALAAMAARDISDVIGVDDTVQAVTEALSASGANPEQIMLLKKMDADFQIRMTELGYKSLMDLQTVAAGDRDSARKREIQVGDKTPRNLAYLYGFGFFAVIAAQIYMGVYGVVMPSGVEKTLDMLLGVLTGMVLGSKEYYFGSSSSSSEKTRLLAERDNG